MPLIDVETWVSGHSSSLEMATLMIDRSLKNSYSSFTATM